jgi:uncharacterized protein with PIN domain
LIGHKRSSAETAGTGLERTPEQEQTMLISADLKCYYCGYVTGEVITDTSHPDRVIAFKPAEGGAPVGKPARRRCARCGGPVYLDEAQTLSPREAAALVNAARAARQEERVRAGA